MAFVHSARLYQVPLFASRRVENRKHLALRQVSLVSSIYHRLSSLPRGEKEELLRCDAPWQIISIPCYPTNHIYSSRIPLLYKYV